MSKRILVIEDTPNNRRILNDLLTNAGFEVIEAVDGEKGVAMAAEPAGAQIRGFAALQQGAGVRTALHVEPCGVAALPLLRDSACNRVHANPFGSGP